MGCKSMLMKQEKILEYIDRLPIETIRAAWVARCRAENDRLDKLEGQLVADGFERVEVDDYLTPDGREVMRVRGRAYALRPDVHAERVARKLAAAQKRVVEKKAAQAAEVNEAIAATTCPQMIGGKPCGGALNRKGVCPGCATGRMGYKYRYTCEACGFDIVTKTELAE